MKVLQFDCLDSTSTHAQHLLDGGEEQVPFAVTSLVQSQGRGRSGRSWVSPEGGLYLTVVLSSDSLSSASKTQLPLAVASGACLWIQQRFGVRLTIKWPNDLLYGGSKLGGILCEGRVHGDHWGPVLIGIGINVRAGAPEVVEQQSTSLEDILKVSLEAKLPDLAADLAHFLAAHLTEQKSCAAYPLFSLEVGQLWVDEQGQWARMKAVTASGHLTLQRLADNSEENLSSVYHGWRWAYQTHPCPPLVVADIGNTRCKIGIYRSPLDPDDKPAVLTLELTGVKAEMAAKCAAFFATYSLPHNWPIYAISVRDQGTAELEALARSLNMTVTTLGKRALRVDLSAYRVDQMGIDRLALIEAGYRAFAGQNLILVSAGTALTIEVLDSAARYRGGYILAGLQTRLDSLHEKTAKLPQIRLFEGEDPFDSYQKALLGDSTETAMIRGVLRELAWTLKGLKNDLEAQLGLRNWHICLAGGDAKILSLITEASCKPDLILDGVRILALGGILAKGTSSV